MPQRLKQFESLNPEAKQKLIVQTVDALENVGVQPLKYFLSYLDGQIEHVKDSFSHAISGGVGDLGATAHRQGGYIAALETTRAGIVLELDSREKPEDQSGESAFTYVEGNDE